MEDFKSRIRPDWGQTLRQVIDVAREAGPKGVLVFDLDSTVFDNRPRQARIVREFGADRGIPKLEACDVQHWASGWDLKLALIACGLSSEEADRIYKDCKAYWSERFFTSKYCVDDVEEPGAAAFLKSAAATGVQIAYVTGRHEEMRSGTVACLEKCVMPVPNGGSVSLVMKPTLRDSDDSFKRTAHKRIEAMGQVVAAFDNEPTHANDYAAQFPHAIVVHLATDHSGRPVQLDPRVISVPDFQM